MGLYSNICHSTIVVVLDGILTSVRPGQVVGAVNPPNCKFLVSVKTDSKPTRKYVKKPKEEEDNDASK